MKKTIIFLLSIIYVVSANAGVRSLGGGSETQNNISPTPKVNLRVVNTNQDCLKHGFTLSHCEVNQIPAFPCPNNPSYFRLCCPQDYRYTQAYCQQHNMEASNDSCGGMFACIAKEQDATPTE